MPGALGARRRRRPSSCRHARPRERGRSVLMPPPSFGLVEDALGDRERSVCRRYAAVDGALQQDLVDLVLREAVAERSPHVHLELVRPARVAMSAVSVMQLRVRRSSPGRDQISPQAYFVISSWKSRVNGVVRAIARSTCSSPRTARSRLHCLRRCAHPALTPSASYRASARSTSAPAEPRYVVGSSAASISSPVKPVSAPASSSARGARSRPHAATRPARACAPSFGQAAR